MPNEITIKHEVTDEFLRDIMTNAVESGGLRYWATIKRVMRDKGLNVLSFSVADSEDAYDAYHDRVNDGVPADEARRLTDNDKELWYAVNKDTILLGLQRIMSGEVRLADDLHNYIRNGVADDEAGDIDSECCDCIVQAALFGEITYG